MYVQGNSQTDSAEPQATLTDVALGLALIAALAFGVGVLGHSSICLWLAAVSFAIAAPLGVHRARRHHRTAPLNVPWFDHSHGGGRMSSLAQALCHRLAELAHLHRSSATPPAAPIH